MKFEDMKKDIPETPEFIHTMIQNEVKKQLQDTQVVHIQKRKKWIGTKVAAAAAVCILATSTIAYAGVKLYHMFLERQGTYSTAVGIKTDDNNRKIDLPEKIHDIDIAAGYIPEGMEWIDKWHLEYPDHSRTGGFSFASAFLDENDLAEDGSFNQRIYLFCPDVYRVITVYIGDDITKEDAIKVAENLVITENDTEIETAGMATWSEMVSPEELSSEGTLISVEDDKLPVYQIGEEFDMSAVGEDNHGNYLEADKISVCVDSVQVADDLQLLDQNRIPEEWKTTVGADGKIINNTLSYIKSGDGVNTLDKIVKTESVKQKLVYASVTYANKTDKEINHMPYLGSLMLMNHEDGMYRIYVPEEQSGNDYDSIIWDGAAKTAEMTYMSVTEDYGNGDNYISSLNPGESIQVNMAWIVNENDLDNMYLNLNGDGAAFEFSESMLDVGLVDIRQ